MKRFLLSFILIFSLVAVFAQKNKKNDDDKMLTAQEAAEEDDSIVIRPCQNRAGDCFYRIGEDDDDDEEEEENERRILTLVVYHQASGKFKKPKKVKGGNLGGAPFFKLLELPNKNISKTKKRVKKEDLKNKNKAAKRFKTGVK